MQKARHYQNALYHELDKLHTSFHSENQLLSVIINHALQKAEQKNICIKLHIEPLTLDFLSDIDMTTIISNILDNALEAVENLPDDQKVIWFFIEKRMSCVIIHSENAFHYVHCGKSKNIFPQRMDTWCLVLRIQKMKFINTMGSFPPLLKMISLSYQLLSLKDRNVTADLLKTNRSAVCFL